VARRRWAAGGGAGILAPRRERVNGYAAKPGWVRFRGGGADAPEPRHETAVGGQGAAVTTTAPGAAAISKESPARSRTAPGVALGVGAGSARTSRRRTGAPSIQARSVGPSRLRAAARRCRVRAGPSQENQRLLVGEGGGVGGPGVVLGRAWIAGDGAGGALLQGGGEQIGPGGEDRLGGDVVGQPAGLAGQDRVGLERGHDAVQGAGDRRVPLVDEPRLDDVDHGVAGTAEDDVAVAPRVVRQGLQDLRAGPVQAVAHRGVGDDREEDRARRAVAEGGRDALVVATDEVESVFQALGMDEIDEPADAHRFPEPQVLRVDAAGGDRVVDEEAGAEGVEVNVRSLPGARPWASRAAGRLDPAPPGGGAGGAERSGAVWHPDVAAVRRKCGAGPFPCKESVRRAP